MKSGEYVKLKLGSEPKIHGQGKITGWKITRNGATVEIPFGVPLKLSAKVDGVLKTARDYPLLNLKFAKKHKEKFEIINKGE